MIKNSETGNDLELYATSDEKVIMLFELFSKILKKKSCNNFF
jgi:hypothetical protein